MKFVCQTCKTKYTISDEKVRNKRLRIRCKKCSNIIEITDPARTSTAPPAAAPRPTLDEPISMVLGENEMLTSVPPKEPAPAATAPSAAAPASLTDRFAQKFQPGTTALGGAAAAPPQPRPDTAEVTDTTEIEQSIWFVAIDNAPVGPVTARAVHKYKQIGRISDDALTWSEGMPDWMPLKACPNLVALLQRLDRIEQSLIARKTPNPLTTPGLGISATAVTAPATVAVASKESRDIFEKATQLGGPVADDFNEGFESDVSRLHHLAPPRSGGNRIYLIASVGFFVTALFTLFFVITDGDEASGEPQTVKTVEKIVEKVVYRDRIVEKEVYRDKDTPGTTAKGMGRKRRSPKIRAAEATPPSDAKTQALMERFSRADPEAGRATFGNTSDREKPTGSSAGTSTLSPAAMKQVVNRNKSTLKACYERALKKGDVSASTDIKVVFKLTVGASGTVKRLDFGGSDTGSGGLKSCLSRSVRQWVFPPSSGNSKIEFPFVFTPTR